ncbi:DAP3 [Lepeophtheirus salmonis]|uniref:Small ribosomal subunit protein mS29 n=1 Tax=Lepeophtheirus salmonis TaxID=72036 RepID=A0A7R8CTD3_LEPSM|nr:DAP3 [Lepeophtheirus salmonis]CAF2887586.1 DAP3 [Lepeophtheirus salmonis]
MSHLVRRYFLNLPRLHNRTHSSSYSQSPESNPTNHVSSHKGKLYKIPQEVVSGVNPTSELKDYNKTFGETHLLIRSPALEVFHYLRADIPKKLGIVLYGPRGSGKSSTLSHVGHYSIADPKLISLNFGSFKSCGRIDHITKSLEVLQEFKLRNESKISELTTHREYIWSARETTPVDAPLIEVLLQGLERPKFSADVLNVLMNELRLSSTENKCKIIVLGDGINAIFNKLTACHREKLTQERIHANLNREFLCVPDELSVIFNLKRLLRAKSNNVTIVTSVDSHDVVRERRVERHRPTRKRPNTDSHLPFTLLGEEGWKTMGPFIPVEVEFYSEEELNIMIDFKLEKDYIRSVAGTSVGRAEINFLTGKSPLDFANYCHYW